MKGRKQDCKYLLLHSLIPLILLKVIPDGFSR
jgi:hypothetical protein